MNLKTISAAAILLLFTNLEYPGIAKAEYSELVVGVQGGLNLPGFDPSSNTAFALGTWTAGVFGEYGILDDLYLTMSFDFSMYKGDANGYEVSAEGLNYQGTLRTSSQIWHPQIGAKYCLYCGYNLAPYLEAKVGYGWASYQNSKLLNDDGADFGIEVKDFAQGFLSLTSGISCNYRIANTLFAGVGVYFTYVVDAGLLEYYVTMPVKISYYW